MTKKELEKILAGKQVVVLHLDDWADVTQLAEVMERHKTPCAGSLEILRLGQRFGALEQPKAKEWVLRPLADETAIKAFIEQRMAAYDRMWDG